MFLAELRAQEAERQSYRDSIRRMIGVRCYPLLAA